MTDSPHPTPVTIGIPTIGRIEFLRQSIISLLEQTLTQWTAIISDDSNSREAEALVDSFHDARLRYVPQPSRLGLFANWNFLLSQADTEFCCILHDDDRYHPDYLHSMLSGMRAHPTARWGFSNAWRVQEGTENRCLWTSTRETCLYPAGGHLLRRLARGSCICCPTVMLHRDIYTTRRFNTAGTYTGDWEYWLSLARTEDALFIGQPLLYFREWAGSTTTSCQKACINLHEDLAVLTWLCDLPELVEMRPALEGAIRNRVNKLCWRIIALPPGDDPRPHLTRIQQCRGKLVSLATFLAKHPTLRAGARALTLAYERRRARHDQAKIRESVVGSL